MADERIQHRLAAILAADVVGYGRMMQADEVGTLAALKSRRAEILQPLLDRHHGRVVKLMGDGVLAEFASAVNAVEFAEQLQQGMNRANEGLPVDRQIQLRVGINVGDVVVEGSDLYGDGVNVASRLEALAEPGTIVVSQAVEHQVRGKLPIRFEDLGEQAIKNMSPVRAYRVVSDAAHISTSLRTGQRQQKPCIAVLPFTNMSSDPAQGYLSDGITEDIITELSRYREIMVIARNSSFQYRDKSIDMKRVGRELGAGYLVEGSIRKAGNRIRVTAQLIEADNGAHLWAEKYDRELQDVFAIQDEVTDTIVATVMGHLERSGAEKARRKPTESWAAYDYVLQANQRVDQYQLDSAIALLLQALELDFGYAHAHAILAMVYVTQFFEDVRWETLSKARMHAERSMQLDSSDPLCQGAIGFVLTYYEECEAAEKHLRLAASLNPSSGVIMGNLANLLVRMGNAEDALVLAERQRRLDPHLPSYYWELLSIIMFQMGRYEDVIKSTSSKTPLQYWDHAYLAAAHVRLGHEEQAQPEVRKVLHLKPDFLIAEFAKQDPFRNPADQARVLETLRLAGLPD